MPVYLGSLGRMIKLPYVVSQQLQQEERYTFKKTLEGKNSAQRIPRGHRSWALTADHFRANESATLQEFADGSWGRGPFWFLSADALVSNVLPPITKVFGNYGNAGPAFLDDGGRSPFSYTPPAGGAGTIQFVGAEEDPPAIPGRKVTGSAYIMGTGVSVMLQFFDVSGAQVGAFSSASVTSTTVAKRASVTAAAPSGTVRVRLTARNTTVAARPAITWTDKLQPYGDGQGCAKAVVHGVSRDQVLAVPGNTFSNLSFTVTEVG